MILNVALDTVDIPVWSGYIFDGNPIYGNAILMFDTTTHIVLRTLWLHATINERTIHHGSTSTYLILLENIRLRALFETVVIQH
jgi:hypothetical protein